jgi:hypothetical protein
MTIKIVLLDVVPDLPYFQYTPSPDHHAYSIGGKLKIELLKPRKISKVTVSLKGFFRFDSKVASSNSSSSVFEVPFVEVEAVIAECPKQFPKGSMELTWRLELPDSLPSSFGGQGAEINYTITAKAVVCKLLVAKVISVELPFDIWRSPRFEPQQRGNTLITQESEIPGRFRYEVKTPKYYAPSRGAYDQLEIQFKLSPLCTKLDVKKLVVQLIEVEDYQ